MSNHAGIPNSSLDLYDLNLGIGLSVTHLLLLVLLGLVLEDDNLLVLAVLQNLCGYLSAVHNGSACLEAVVVRESNNLIEDDFVSFIDIELFDKNNVLLDYLVLLSAGFDNCKHEKHLTFI